MNSFKPAIFLAASAVILLFAVRSCGIDLERQSSVVPGASALFRGNGRAEGNVSVYALIDTRLSCRDHSDRLSEIRVDASGAALLTRDSCERVSPGQTVQIEKLDDGNIAYNKAVYNLTSVPSGPPDAAKKHLNCVAQADSSQTVIWTGNCDSDRCEARIFTHDFVKHSFRRSPVLQAQRQGTSVFSGKEGAEPFFHLDVHADHSAIGTYNVKLDDGSIFSGNAVPGFACLAWFDWDHSFAD